MIEQSRRGFLLGLGVLAATPAIVRADSLMRLRGVVVPTYYYRAIAYYDIGTDAVIVSLDKKRQPLPVPVGVEPIDNVRLDRLISLFDPVLGDLEPDQQRRVDFRIPHSGIHPHSINVMRYIDEMQVWPSGRSGAHWSGGTLLPPAAWGTPV